MYFLKYIFLDESHLHANCLLYILFIYCKCLFPVLIKHIPIQTRVQTETLATDILIGA